MAGGATGTWSAAARVLLLSVLVFIGALGTHETMHLITLYALGGHGSLVVRPWHLAMVDASIYALHVQPDQPIGLLRQALVNFMGPTLAAIPLVVLLANVRDRVARIALVANVAILAFYALIETADLILEVNFNVDVPMLTTPEFNYGVPVLILLIATYSAASGAAASRSKRGSPHRRASGHGVQAGE
jgi:hypothetical protein